MRKQIIYYTDNRLDAEIDCAVRRQIERAGIPVISVSLLPINFGRNIVLPLECGYLTMFKQILAGLEASDADIIFFCEHDVLYHPSHFDFIPEKNNTYYYNENVYKVQYPGGRAVFYFCQQTSGLCAERQILLKHYRERVARVERNGFSREMGFEPGTHNRPARVDDYKASSWLSEYPNIDIRHIQNLTLSRWRKEQFRNQKFTVGWKEVEEVPCWGKVADQGIVKIIRKLND